MIINHRRNLLQSLPPTVVDVSLQFPADHGRDAVLQPDGTKESVVALLVEKELPVSAQARVDFAVLVEVGRVRPAAIVAVQIENGAFANVDEETDVNATSVGS